MALVSTGCGLISMNVVCSAPAAATAWLEPHRVCARWPPSSRRRTALRDRRFQGGADDRDRVALGVRSASADPQLRQDRVHHRVMGGDIHIDPAGKGVLLGGTAAMMASIAGRAGDHGLARRGIHRDRTSRWPAIRCLGGLGIESINAIAPVPLEPGHQTATGWRSPATRRQRSARRPPPRR